VDERRRLSPLVWVAVGAAYLCVFSVLGIILALAAGA
jgi:hypothetical protein